MPPTNGTERGRPKKLRNTARPKRPNTIDGTAARLLILTSIRSVQRFLGANSSRYTAEPTPTGNVSARVTIMVSSDPTTAPQMPASSGSREAPLVKNSRLNWASTMPF